MSKKRKRKLNKRALLITIMMLLCLIAGAFSIYSLSLLSGIETMIRMVLSGIIGVLALALLYGLFKSLRKKNKKYFIYLPLVIIYSTLLIGFGYYVTKTYLVIDNFTQDATTYSSSMVTLKDNKVDDIKDIKGKIGIVSDKDNVIGNTIPQEVIKKEKLDVKTKEYDTYIDLINALYDEEVDYIFLPTNYIIMFSNYEGQDLSSLESDTKIIYTKEKKVKNTKTSKSNSLNKPFTILLMGVDSENEELGSSAFNGDSLMLITFNPENLNATMLSIPRDTYVPIMCFANQNKSKITHAAWYGEDCMMDTIENFTGIDIDYYVKINFKGVVKIVDTLGGIEVDVPYSFCESDSNRKFGNNTIYIDAGLQTLNGEQALAFSRNRHTWPEYCGKAYSNYTSNDFVRGQNQQTVVKAILNKLKEKGDLNTIYKLLDVVSNSMETNMSTNEILSLYNIGKDAIAKSSGATVDDIIGIQKLYLSGYGTMDIYDVSMGMYLYNYVLYQESLDDVVKAMKINLGKEEPEMIKEFSFDIDEEYEQLVIGKTDSGTAVSYGKNSAKKDTSDKSTSSSSTKTCGTNEELGADGVSCVCKYGYTKVNGSCVEKEDTTKTETKVEEKETTKTCGTNEELGADKVTCVCKSGYTKVSGTCVEKEEEDTTYKNKCVGDATNGYYYYDADGNKNPTKYIEATCTQEESDND